MAAVSADRNNTLPLLRRPSANKKQRGIPLLSRQERRGSHCSRGGASHDWRGHSIRHSGREIPPRLYPTRRRTSYPPSPGLPGRGSTRYFLDSLVRGLKGRTRRRRAGTVIGSVGRFSREGGAEGVFDAEFVWRRSVDGGDVLNAECAGLVVLGEAVAGGREGEGGGWVFWAFAVGLGEWFAVDAEG